MSGLIVSDLSVSYGTPRGRLRVLRDVSLAIAPGEVLGLVGESGSGKSTLAYAVVDYLAGNARVESGGIEFDGAPLLGADAARLRAIRGKLVGMVYQDPSTALNPSLRLGEQVAEALVRHEGMTQRQAEARTAELLAMVRLPDPRFIMRRFPHEVSGGEKQRVLIAMAFACRPKLLVFDEPTTALDATTAATILDLIRTLQRESGAAALYITHDLGLVAQIAGRVAVIYGGSIVETGETTRVLAAPRHFYTRMLVASAPNPHRGGARRRLVSFLGAPPDLVNPPQGCIFAARCPARIAACEAAPPPMVEGSACLRASEVAAFPLVPEAAPAATRATGGELLRVEDVSVEYVRSGLLDQLLRRPGTRVSAVDRVSFTLSPGETLGLIGESGCGKSTLARALVGLRPFRGQLALRTPEGEVRVTGGARFPPAWRRAVQIVFQHPDQSLNPRMRVGEIVGRPLALHAGLSGEALRRASAEWLERARLPAAYASRFPHELSGGEKQRVALARAFAAAPRLVICDEVTSGLDVSVQAAVLNLLAELQEQTGTALILISHDLNMVQHVADRVAVMYLGRIVEERRVAGPLAPPYHPYAEALLAAAPVPDAAVRARRVRLEGPLPSPAAPPPGCRFATRCPRRIGDVCDTPPPWRALDEAGHRALCHLTPEALRAIPPVFERESTP